MNKVIKTATLCPDGYELDKEKSTIENLVFKIKKISYYDIWKKLFYKKKTYFFDDHGIIRTNSMDTSCYTDPNNCTSKNQANKLLAINKLLNVAKYLNDGWQPDWQNANEFKYCITIDYNSDILSIHRVRLSSDAVVYFKTIELAWKAINILGEETIKLALSTDW